MRADGDTHRGREAIKLHRAHDDPFVEQPHEVLLAVAPGVDQQEIPDRGRVARAEQRQFFGDEFHFPEVRLDRARHVLAVIQSGQGRRLSDAIGVEGRADAVQSLDQLGMPATVTDPQSCEAVDLGEGPQHQDVPAGPDVVERAGIVRPLDVIAVRFIQHHQHARRQHVEQMIELQGREHHAGGVVGVPEVDHFRALRHRARDCPEIEGHIPQRSQDQARSHLLDGQAVNVEGGFGSDAFVAGG